MPKREPEKTKKLPPAKKKRLQELREGLKQQQEPPKPVAQYMDREALAQEMSKFSGFLANQMTPQLRFFLHCPAQTIGFFGGNQSGKTHNPAFGYFLRLIGKHPVPEKNRLIRHVRCLAAMQPEGTDQEAEAAAQYVALKRLLPAEMVLKDITARNKTMTVAATHFGKSYFEFVSTKQELQTTGGVQRSSLWDDEEAPMDFREEALMRLLAENGDEVISLTPTNGISYLYWHVWMKAGTIWRTPTVANHFGWPEIETREKGDPNIVCIQMATDDNPTLSKDAMERLFAGIDDPDTLAIRRYGVFKQVMGRVHKAYDTRRHFISMEKYFPEGIPMEWRHARGIDYHDSRIPWSVGWLSASKDDEWFLNREFHPAIDGSHSMTTREICRSIARKSGDYDFICNLIDPWAGKKQANTGFSTIEDMNRIFLELRKTEGLGSNNDYWQPWDTKNEKGRDIIKERFKNAALVGKPFNNVGTKRGEKVKLPTLWILNTCPRFDQSLQKWSFMENILPRTKQVNEPPSKPQQKFSHDCMVLECLAKDVRLKLWERIGERPKTTYSQSGRPMYGRG